MITEQKFDELEHVLYGSNYQVFLRLYRNSQLTKSSEEAIQAIFPDAVIGNIVSVTADEVLSDVEQAIHYVGDDSAGPSRGRLESEPGRRLSEEFMACVRELASSAVRMELFWLKEGCPVCPIFWGFSFIFTGAQGTVVLVGASED